MYGSRIQYWGVRSRIWDWSGLGRLGNEGLLLTELCFASCGGEGGFADELGDGAAIDVGGDGDEGEFALGPSDGASLARLGHEAWGSLVLGPGIGGEDAAEEEGLVGELGGLAEQGEACGEFAVSLMARRAEDPLVITPGADRALASAGASAPLRALQQRDQAKAQVGGHDNRQST